MGFRCDELVPHVPRQGDDVSFVFTITLLRASRFVSCSLRMCLKHRPTPLSSCPSASRFPLQAAHILVAIALSMPCHTACEPISIAIARCAREAGREDWRAGGFSGEGFHGNPAVDQLWGPSSLRISLDKGPAPSSFAVSLLAVAVASSGSHVSFPCP